jgi:hypothetical protein
MSAEEAQPAKDTAMVRGRIVRPKSPPKKPGPKRNETPGIEGAGYVSLGIKFPAELYRVLKLVSASRLGDPAFTGRASISAIVSEMVAANFPELKKEAVEYLKREGTELGVTRSR